MTNDDVIRMAREAGVDNSWDINWFDPDYARFAKLVAAAEREACAKIVEMPWQGHFREVAAQIRARGQHD